MHIGVDEISAAVKFHQYVSFDAELVSFEKEEGGLYVLERLDIVIISLILNVYGHYCVIYMIDNLIIITIL